MMRNPFQRHATQEQTDAAYDTLGWGTKVQRRVPRPAGGESLHFQLRLPNEARYVEVADLAAAARDSAPAMLQGQVATLERAADAGGTFLLGAISMDNEPGDIMATVAAALAPLADDPPAGALAEPVGWDVIEHESERLSRSMTSDGLVIATKTWGPNHDQEFAVRIDQYLMSSQYGAVAVTFTSSHDGMVGGTGWHFFRQVMKTVWLGETPDPPQ
jgi:hypothetical protein